MTRLILPIGEQSFEGLRSDGCYYVDKTHHLQQLIDKGKFYFLSRPRRFGKSLLMDTLHELFEGNEELFRGLHIHDRWDWNARHPVVRLSFDINYDEPGNLNDHVFSQLSDAEQVAGVAPPPASRTAPARLQELIRTLHRTTGQRVVILVDEYDKPILDVIEDHQMARTNRDYLRGIYSSIKGCARHLRFVFVTGVSMFSRVSLFSGLNNLKDISLDPRYATICGYTDQDIDTVFAPELEGLDRRKIRRWYNGYNWLGENGNRDKVYNPYDILLLFDTRVFEPYWYETGEPQFLYRKLRQAEVGLLELRKRIIEKNRVSKMDVGKVGAEALLFQTGYLTIVDKKRIESDSSYILDYPNFEVRKSLSVGLLGELDQLENDVKVLGRQLCEQLKAHDFEGFGRQLHSYLSGIPYHWHRGGELARREAWYASLLYACLQTLEVDLRTEDVSSEGRADLVLLYGRQVFVLELKVATTDAEVESKVDEAMEQMRARGYADKYRNRDEPIHHIAVVFSQEKHNLVAIRTELASKLNIQISSGEAADS